MWLRGAMADLWDNNNDVDNVTDKINSGVTERKRLDQ